MKHGVLALLFAGIILMSSAGANAIQLDADCYGWSFSVSFTVPADIEYTIDLYQGGSIVWTFTETYSATPYEVLNFSGTWGMELCGDYTAHIDFNYDMGQGWRVIYYDTDFTCECEEYGCTYTPGYWKNHPDAWPVDLLVVGGVDYSQFHLLQIFALDTGGDMTIKLFHHLVAAKLNVLSGSDPSIQPTIDAADAFLMDYPLFSNPKGALKDMAEALKDELCAYNELPCPEDDGDMEMLEASPRAILNAPAATEETSWGALKKKM
ncbi:MAG: hypothetical protein PHQ19_08180 [Candidatus Krumholzibacteria bacterium]|nr:hypothetical protein [Candidatus Krumholzibacteria bacterium]